MRTIRLFTFTLSAIAICGCGKESSESVPTYPVSGKVTYNGKPAGGVQVFLYPTSAPTIPQIPSNPHGTTEKDGTFTLTTYREGDGAPEGGYQVILNWPAAKEDDDDEATTDRLQGWYDAAHSKLRAQIKSGDNALPPFNLPAITKPPEQLMGIPGRN